MIMEKYIRPKSQTRPQVQGLIDGFVDLEVQWPCLN